jgi:lactoylglutathione lyase
MTIEHIAMWVKDLERMKKFYERFFSGTSSAKYHNPRKQFESYFISFGDSARLELMRSGLIPLRTKSDTTMRYGFAHIALSVGSEEKVDEVTDEIRRNGYRIESEPRRTGDGYYESSIRDPEGNLVEITV